MKKILVIILLLCSVISQGQIFDDVKTRYEGDSVFAMKVDSAFHNYVDLESVTVFGNTFIRLYGIEWRDYGCQPYEILHYRDSMVFNIDGIHGLDTGILHLDPLIEITKSGACFFTIFATTSTQNESISINNINTNAYDASVIYGWKFRYWYLADKLGLNLK